MEDNTQLTPEESAEASQTQPQESTVTAEQVQELKEKLKMEQNLTMGILASVAAALVGAALWAVITVATKYQIGYMAVAVGFLVGYANRFAGKGIDQVFGIIGALLAFVGCVLGNYFTVIALAAEFAQMSFFETLTALPLSTVMDILVEDISFYDILFYGIALYEGYKFSFRQITEDDLRKHMNTSVA